MCGYDYDYDCINLLSRKKAKKREVVIPDLSTFQLTEDETLYDLVLFTTAEYSKVIIHKYIMMISRIMETIRFEIIFAC